MAEHTHDLVVIGGGPGGYVAAVRGAQLGLNVACIEESPQLGGTCLRVGCIPSKALLESSHLYALAKEQLGEHGVQIEQMKLDLQAMLARKDKVVEGLTQGVAALLKKNKVTHYHGRGRIDGLGKVVVDGEGESHTLHAENILIATGSRSAKMRGVEEDGDRIGNSTTALNYPEVPQHLVVIGAGYIGLELGSVWSRLGAKVTVLEALDRPLPGMDAEIARQARRAFEKQGLEFRFGSWVEGATVENGQCVIRCKGAEPVTADRVLVSVGRTPNTAELGLETVDIETDGRGFIPIDEDFSTSAANIYAIGDCVGGAMLAHKASEEGVACVERIVTGVGTVHYNTIPAIVYTNPEIATVGKTEEQLKEEGREYRKGVSHYRGNGRARALGEVEGLVKILADAQTDRILGVHIIGAHAGDLIAEAVAAMQFGASSEDLARTCHAHPTLSEIVHEAALDVDRRAIHA